MSTSTAIRPAVQAAVGALIDYAGLFPPAKLPLLKASAEYRQARSGPHAWMLGRFIIPASLLPEQYAPHPEQHAHRHPERSSPQASAVEGPLSVIVDAELDPRAWFASARKTLENIAVLRSNGARIEALEAPLPPLTTRRETFDATIGQLSALIDRAGLRDLPTYAEIPRRSPFDSAFGFAQGDGLLSGAMAAAARAGLGAKLRCGGVTAEAFPSVDEVAEFIAAAGDANVPFKATAGLHHPVRHLDSSSGFTMHGFLNILAAAVFAPRVDRETLRQIVAEEEPGAFAFDEISFAWRDRRAGVDELVAARTNAFAAYGSCSFAEPIEDLTALGILPNA